MDFAQLLFVGCVAAFTLIALVWDARTSKLPNVLTIPALALGVAFHVTRGALADGMPGALAGLQFSAIGMLVGFALLLLLYLMGSGGGGDVKFMAALGAWLGLWCVVAVFILGAYLGGVFSLVSRRIKKNAAAAPSPLDTAPAVQENQSPAPNRPRATVPFGVPAALATWAVLAFVMLTDRRLW